MSFFNRIKIWIVGGKVCGNCETITFIDDLQYCSHCGAVFKSLEEKKQLSEKVRNGIPSRDDNVCGVCGGSDATCVCDEFKQPWFKLPRFHLPNPFAYLWKKWKSWRNDTIYDAMNECFEHDKLDRIRKLKDAFSEKRILLPQRDVSKSLNNEKIERIVQNRDKIAENLTVLSKIDEDPNYIPIIPSGSWDFDEGETITSGTSSAIRIENQGILTDGNMELPVMVDHSGMVWRLETDVGVQAFSMFDISSTVTLFFGVGGGEIIGNIVEWSTDTGPNGIKHIFDFIPKKKHSSHDDTVWATTMVMQSSNPNMVRNDIGKFVPK